MTSRKIPIDEANDTSPKEKILKAFKTSIEKEGENKSEIS